MLKAASTGTPVFVACARNAFAALDAALSKGRRIGIFCSGRKGRPSWDDTLCAGLLVAHLIEHFPDARLADSARLAHLASKSSKDFKASLETADHAVFLEKIGYGKDVAFAAEVDAVRVVPELFERPEEKEMRAVLRLGTSMPLSLDNRSLLGPLGLEAEVPLSTEPEKVPGQRQIPVAWGEESSVEEVFFAGESYRKQRRSKTRKS
jgi:hypothetical protein